MIDQQLSYKQNSDSGDNDDASIQPVSSEPATPESVDRPIQHLRRRSERVRAAIETLLYLSDYDRALVLRSNAKFALTNSTDYYTLSMVSGTEDDLWIYPSLSPGRLSGGRNKGGRVYVSGLPYSGVLLTNDIAFTLHSDYTGQRGYADGATFDGGGSNPALSLGANGVRLTLAANAAAATGVITATITGSPKRKITITYGTLGGSTTIDQIIAWVNNPSNLFGGLDYGPATFFRASRDSATPGSAAPTPFTDAGVLGAYDAEAHQVTVAQLAAFFGVSDNRLKEGEGLAISYAPGPVESGTPVPRGGRRQSTWDLPVDRSGTKSQNTTPSVGYSLFNTGREPEKIPGAIPIGKVIGGEFVFIDGTRVAVGSPVRLGEAHTIWDALGATTTPTGASLTGYGGGPAYNADASGTTSPQLGAGTLEATLDQLLSDIANQSTSQSGARRIGVEALTPTASSGNFTNRVPTVSASSIRSALAEMLGIGNAYGMAFRMHETGHTMRGGDPLRKNFGLSGMPASGSEFLRGELHAPVNAVAATPAGVNETSYWSVQPLVYNVDSNDNLTAAETGTYASSTTLTVSSMTLTRFSNVFAKLPLVQDATTSQPVPLVFVYLTGATGAADAADGYYYITAKNTGTGVITLKKQDGSDPDFTGLVATPTLTFCTHVRDGNDKRYTRRFWHHWGKTDGAYTATGNTGAIVGVNDVDAKLLSVYTPNGNAGTLQSLYWANRVIWTSTRRTAGGAAVRRTVDILTQTDKELLDGSETNAPVDATNSHHHGGTYTATRFRSGAYSYTAVTDMSSGPWFFETPGDAPAGYIKSAVILSIACQVGILSGASSTDLVGFTIEFAGSTDFATFYAGTLGSRMTKAAVGTTVLLFQGQVTVPVYFDSAQNFPTGATGFKVRIQGGSAGGGVDLTLSELQIKEIGYVLRRS